VDERFIEILYVPMNRRAFFRTAAAPVALSGQQRPSSRERRAPNVVFFLFDKCRTDAIGAYGAPGVHTPNMDWIAANGVRFQNCYTPQALCAPARASLITGLYPHAHGLRKNVYPEPLAHGNPTGYDEPIPSPFFDKRFRLWDNFALHLHTAGYETAHIGKWHLGVANPGFFDTWKSFNSAVPHWIGKPYESRYRPDVQTEQGIEFVRRNAAKPFFLYLSYYPPHELNDPPREFLIQYRGKDREHSAYYGAVSNLDWNVGRVLGTLRSEGLIDHTLLVVTTDHGRTWKLRPGNRDGISLSYDDAARVPLLLRYPGVFAGGKVWQSGVSTADLMPTILDLCGVSTEFYETAQLNGNAVDLRRGRSLAPYVASGRDDWDRLIVTQNLSQHAYHDYYFEERGLRYRRWKLILRRFDVYPLLQDDELYDLDTDPEEAHNVIAEHPDVVGELATLLEDWADPTGDSVGLELARRTLKSLKKSLR
jgi:arylsulfatase A-like enzyme